MVLLRLRVVHRHPDMPRVKCDIVALVDEEVVQVLAELVAQVLAQDLG